MLKPPADLVATAWLQLAVPDVRVGQTLPAADDALRQVGFVRAQVTGGSPGRYVPFRAPVVVAECWVAPGSGTGQDTPRPWRRAAQLAERVLAATYDRALMGVLVDLSAVGNYAPARVHTVTALTEPRLIPGDPQSFARYDLDLTIRWTSLES